MAFGEAISRVCRTSYATCVCVLSLCDSCIRNFFFTNQVVDFLVFSHIGMYLECGPCCGCVSNVSAYCPYARTPHGYMQCVCACVRACLCAPGCQPSCVFCVNQTGPTSAIDDAFCPILRTVGTLGLGRDFEQLEAFHVLYIMNDLL